MLGGNSEPATALAPGDHRLNTRADHTPLSTPVAQHGPLTREKYLVITDICREHGPARTSRLRFLRRRVTQRCPRGVIDVPVSASAPAPYAPAAAILEVIRRHRSRGLASVNAEVLARGSIVSDSLIPRTLQTLKTLDLIDDDGQPTETFEGLRLAPEAEFASRIGQWLNVAYADVVKHVDPDTADETALRDAFRTYTPIGQQPRMVSLFVGLYAAAGIGREKDSAPRAVRRTRSNGSVLGNGSGGPRRAASAATAAMPVDETPGEDRKPSQHPPASAPPTQAAMSDKALEYKLVDLLKNDDIADDARQAVWTLIQYLAGRVRQASRTTGATE